MAFFNFGKNKPTAPQQPVAPQQPTQPTQPVAQPANTLGLNLSKEESLIQLDLRKQQITSLCLTKAPLSNLTCRVCVAMDYSGSMRELYKNGFVQNVLERLLPMAMQFDDNGEMEMWLFETEFRRVNPVSLNNFYNYIKNENFLQKYHMGGTNYAPVMKDIFRKYVVEEPANIPTYVLFLTDGNNFDHGDTNEIIREVSKYPIFWQFVGMGNAKFDYLERLDNLKGRFVDNANFFSVNDLNALSDNELYSRLLNEYPQWLVEAKQKGIY